MRQVRLLEPPRIVGGNHLKLRVGQGRYAFDAIGFQLGSLRDFLMQHRHNPLDVAFSPSADTFTGTRKVTMELKDLRVTGA
jgi:single-stranded-DNA-specific exonuclease